MAVVLLESVSLTGNSEPTAAVESDNEVLPQQVVCLLEEIKVLQAALDEVREKIDRLMNGSRPDDRRSAPTRSIVSMPVDPTAKDFAKRINNIEPDDLPDEISEQVRSTVAVRLRESQGQGVNSLTHQQRPDETVSDLSANGKGHSVQQSLWDAFEEPSEPEIVATVNGSGEERPKEETDRKTPYTFNDFQAFFEQQRSESITAEEWKAHFHWLIESKDTFLEGLARDHNAKQLTAIAMRFGIFDARRNNKSQNAESIYRAMLQQYILGSSFQWQPMSETIEEAATRQVEAITDEAIAEERERIAAQRAEREKALSAPETVGEFRRFLVHRSSEDLSDEQMAKWDALEAEVSRKARKETRQNDSVEQFRSEELGSISFHIIEGFHDKRQVPLHIVQMSTRVERATFNELKVKAKQLGGWWSSFKKATAGFQFLSRESADKFVSLTQGDADSSEEQLAKKLFKMDNASERLQTVAETLETRAHGILAADETKLKNTTRRASMAAGQRANAFGDLAAAKTLRSISDSLEAGKATYLDRIWNAKQIETLKHLLSQARRDRIRHQLAKEGHDQRGHGWNLRYDDLEGEPYQDADVRHAKYPTPYLYKNHLVQAIASLSNTPGVKQVSAKMQKLVQRVSAEQDFVEFTDKHEVALLEDFLGRAKAAGHNVYWFDHCLDSYKRLRSANIYNDHELRMALRELIPHLTQTEGDDPVTRAEDELRGKKLDSFFPTPKPIIQKMLQQADIQPTDRVLEPSAGKGDILDLIRREHPDVDLQAIERNRTLQDILTAKGHGTIVEYGDFLEHQGEYNKIVMNPPFEKGQDIDHVRHAYELLADGGRLISVMCKGPFFRTDAKSQEFREWLDLLDHEIENLPEDAFQSVESFRQTGVQTVLVTIEKSQ